jgi:hypothetical protein
MEENQDKVVSQQASNRLEETNREIRGEQSNAPDTSLSNLRRRNIQIEAGADMEAADKAIAERQAQRQSQEQQQQARSSSADRILNAPLRGEPEKPTETQKSFEDQMFDKLSQKFSPILTEQAGTGEGQFATKELEYGQPPKSWELDKQNDFLGIPHYDKYQGSAWDDFSNSLMNAGMVRTAQGIANLIPSIASATTGADWAAGWIDTVNDWADRNEGYVSQTGNKSFFDTWDVRSLAAGAGQGVGSILPMVAASLVTGGVGGVAGLIGGTGLRAGASAALASYGTAAGMAASTLNMMPSLVEEGLANGLTHQQATSLSLAIAPIVGLMDKVGLDEAIKAGATAGKGGISKQVLNAAFSNMKNKGLKPNQMGVKSMIGEIASAHKNKILAELAEEGIEKGVKGYTRKAIGATVKGVAKEVGYRGSRKLGQTASAMARGSFAEATTESLQSLIETAGKQIYDLQFASEGATVGQGKFGADIMSQDAWMAALEEGFYGGLIGGSFSMAGAANKVVRDESILSALESAEKRGRLDSEVKRMQKVLEANKELNDEQKAEIYEVINTSGQMVMSMPSELTNSRARHQIFRLSHFARQLQGDIDQISEIENSTMPVGMEDLAAAKRDKLTKRLADVKRAIGDIYATSQEVDKKGRMTGGRAIDLDAIDETTGQKKYFINDITGVEVTGKSTIEVNPDIAKAEKIKTDARVGRFADRIMKGEQMTSPEDMQFYENNKQAIEELLKQRQSVPAVTQNEVVRLKEDFDEINPVISQAQDQDLEYINKSAEAEHEVAYGKDIATKLNKVIDDISSDDTLLNDDYSVKTDITNGQRNAFVDKLVTARRSVLEMIESAPTQEAKENLANFDALLRQKIQEAKALDVKEDKQLETQKRIGDEQIEIKPEGTVSAKEQKTTSPSEQKTEGGTRQIEGVKSTQEKQVKDTGAASSPTSDLNEGKAEGVASPELKRLNDSGVREGGFADNRQVLNAYNKYIDLDYEGNVTPEVVDSLIDYYGKTTPEERKAIPKAKDQRDARATQQQTTTQTDVVGKSFVIDTKKNGTAKVVQDLGDKVKLDDGRTVLKSRLQEEATTDTTQEPKVSPTLRGTVKSEAEGGVEGAKGVKSEQDVMSDEEKQQFTDDFINRMFGGNQDPSKLAKTGTAPTIESDPAAFAQILDYVKRMFPNVDIEVLPRVFGADGIEVLGKVYENRILINGSKATQDVLFHELAHKFSPLLSGFRVWSRGLDLIKGTSYMDTARQMYPELDEDGIAEEALVSLIGEKSIELIEQRVGKSLLPKIKAWLKQFWSRLKYVLNKANANDMANIMAWDLAMKNKPVESSGLNIGGEKLAKLRENKHLPTFNAVKLAALKVKLHLKSYPDQAKKGMGKTYFEAALKKSHENLVAEGKLQGNYVEFDNWKKNFKEHIDFWEDTLDAQLEEAGLDGFDKDPEYSDADIQKKSESFIDAGEKLDENVRSLLASLTDDLGNELPISRVYGVLTHISSITKDPAFYLSNLRKFAKSKTISSIDKGVATQLDMILSNLPDNYLKPIQAQLGSLVNVPHTNVYIGADGRTYVNYSNNKINQKGIINSIFDKINASFTNAFISGDKIVDSRTKDIAALKKKAKEFLVKVDKENFGYKELKAIMPSRAVIENDLEIITGVPIKLDWFGDSKSATVQEKYVTIFKNLANFTEDLSMFHGFLKKAVENYPDNQILRKAKIKEAVGMNRNMMFGKVSAMANLIDSSYGERTVFRNVMGNQQMGYKIGGFLHKLFSNRAMFDRDFSKHEGFKGAVGSAEFTAYVNNWSKNSRDNKPNVVHSDGIKSFDGKAVQFDNMNEAEKDFFNVQTMFGSIEVDEVTGRKSYLNSVGTLSNRKFASFVNVPIFDLNYAESIRQKILAKAKKDGVPEGVHPSDKALNGNKKAIREQLTNAFAKNPKSIETMLQPFSDISYNEFYKKERAKLGKDDDVNLFNSQVEQMYQDYLMDKVLDNAVDTMAVNELVNRYVVKSMLLGDLSQFKTPNDILKRIDKTTSPVQNYDLRKDRTGKQPETITIILDDVMTEESKAKNDPDELESASNSWGYFSPYLAQKIQEQGGALIDYGNSHKPLINEVNENGQFTYIKFAAQSFLNMKSDEDYNKYYQRKQRINGKSVPVVNADGTPALDTHGQIGQALDKLQKKYPDTPIVVTYASAVKSKGLKSTSVENFLALANEGKLPETADRRVYQNFGAQFNINKNLTEKGADGEYKLKTGQDVALGVQLLNVIQAGLPESAAAEIKEFQNILAKMTDSKVGAISSQLKNKAATIKQALKATGQGLSPFVSDLLDTIVETKPEKLKDMKFDHYDIASALQRYLGAQISKGVKHRVNGAELLQTTDLNNDLEYFTQDGDGNIAKGTVKVPEGVAKIGDTVIQVRIPTSNKINIFIGEVVGHTPPDSNITVMPNQWIDASSADNDGDKMFTMVKSDTKKSEDIQREWVGWINTKQYSPNAGKAIVRADIPNFDVVKSKTEFAAAFGYKYDADTDTFVTELSDQLFDAMEKLALNPAVWNDNNGYKERLTTKDVQDAVFKAEATLGIHESVDAAKEADEKATLELSSMNDESKASDKLKDSGKIIGIFAVGAKVINELSTSGVELAADYPVNLPLTGIPKRIKAGRTKFVTDSISQLAQGLQQALDDAKAVFMHKTGITRDNANMAVLAMATGYSLEDVVTFFKHPAVQAYQEIQAEKKGLFPKTYSDEDAEIVKRITERFKGDKATKFLTEKKSFIDAYKNLRRQSALIGDVASVIQLDSGTSRDNISLMDYDATVAKLESYLDGDKKNKIKLATLGNFLTNPVVKSRMAAQEEFRNTLKNYFSLVLTDKEIKELYDKGIDFKGALDSFEKLDNNNKSRIGQKALTKTIALSTSEYKYSGAALQSMVDNLLKTVENLKLDPNYKGAGWLNLIGIKYKLGFGRDQFAYNNTPEKLIPTYRNSATPELDLDEAGQVSPQFLQRQWDMLDADIREQILEYAIRVEGFINEGQNITHLIPSSVFEAYLDKMSDVDAKETINDEFLDNMIREGAKDVIENREFEVDLENETSTQIVKNRINSSYFKVKTDEGDYIYKIKRNEDGKLMQQLIPKVGYSVTATLIAKPDDLISVGGKTMYQYKVDESNKKENIFEPINADEMNSAEANIEQSVSNDIGQQFSLFKDGDFDDSELEMQVSDQTRKERAVKTNRRLLRRLSNKFNIPFKIINDPDFKVAGFYDPNTNTVVINEAYATDDTPIHEFAHPFISSIKKRNPELYNNLISQLNNDEQGKQILEEVKEARPDLPLDKQQEEALVQLLGELSANKVKSLTLKQQLLELFNQIKNIVKQLFGAQADIIQEKMDINTTLNDLSDMILDTKTTVDLDVQMDDRFRRAMDYASRSVERLAKIFNPAVEVVKAVTQMSSEQLETSTKLKVLGLLSNKNYIVKRKGQAVKTRPLSFRVKFADVDTWKDTVKEEFPEFKITDVTKSNIRGYKMYEVSIGQEENVYIHVPLNATASSSGSITYANIDYQMAAGTTRPNYNANTDENVFGGLPFDLDSFEVSDVEFTDSPEKIRAVFNDIWNKQVGKNFTEASWNALSVDKRQELFSKIIDATVRDLMDSYESTTSAGKLTGSLKDLVYTDEIKDSLKELSHLELWKEFISTGQLPNAAPQEFMNAAISFQKMVEVNTFLKNNNDYLIKNGKRVNTNNVAMDIISRAAQATNSREDFFNKFPLVGKLYKYLTKNLQGLRTFTLNMFTPEVMANVVTGQEKNFLHQLVNDDMIDADAKDALFSDEVSEYLYNSVPAESHEAIRKYSDWLQEDKENTKTIAIKGLHSAIPVAKALSLYLSLRQADVKSKVVKNNKVKVSFFDEVSKKELTADIDVNLFETNFKSTIEQTPQLRQLVQGIDATMEEIYNRSKDNAKNFTGTELPKIPNYFPVNTGTRSSIKNDEGKRRIEDFVNVKERGLDTKVTLRMEDAFQVVDGYIRQASKFNAYAEPISNIRKLIKAIDTNGNENTKGVVSYMYDMIDSIQDYRQLQSMSDKQWDNIIRKGMNNFTLAVLGWNPAVALKQVVSIVAAAPELGLDVVKSKNGRTTASRILKNSYKDSKIGKGQIGQLDLNDPTLVEIMDLDPLFKQRFKGFIDRDQGEYRSANSNPFSKESKKTKIFGKKFQMDKTMEMIKIHDAAAIAWIYEDIKAKNPDISKAELKKKLREVVMRTQPTYNVSSRTNLSRSNNPLMRLFTMFSSQRAKNMNMMVSGILNYATNPDERNKKAMKASLLAIGVLSSLGIAVIDKLKYLIFGGGEDDEDLTDIVLDIGAMSMLNTVGNVYFAGQFAQMVDANIRNKPFGKSVDHPVFQTVGISAKALADLSKGNFWKATDGALQTGFRVMGAPLWPYTNIVKKGAKSIGSGSDGGSSSSKGESSGSIQGEASTATERAAMYARQTALIKADIKGRQQVAEFMMKRSLQKQRQAASEAAAQRRFKEKVALANYRESLRERRNAEETED